MRAQKFSCDVSNVEDMEKGWVVSTFTPRLTP